MSAEPKKEETPSSPPQKTEGEMVIELLQDFQKDIKNLRSQLTVLDDKVNKEIPADLDAAFTEIKGNFEIITKSLQAISARAGATSTVAAAAAQEKGSGGFMGIVESIGKGITKAIEGGGGGGSGGLSEMDKKILDITKQIQMITLKDVLKKTAKSAGVELPDHIVVTL